MIIDSFLPIIIKYNIICIKNNKKKKKKKKKNIYIYIYIINQM